MLWIIVVQSHKPVQHTIDLRRGPDLAARRIRCIINQRRATVGIELAATRRR